MFSKALTHAGHVRRFTISDLQPDGWEVRVEQDSAVLRQFCYNDWHRVERALSAMEVEMQQLERNGWQDASRDAAAYSTNR